MLKREISMSIWLAMDQLAIGLFLSDCLLFCALSKLLSHSVVSQVKARLFEKHRCGQTQYFIIKC